MYIKGVCLMVSAASTEFRKRTAAYLDKVENGETVIITRHGRPVAKVIPELPAGNLPSWKRPRLPLSIKGVNLSRAILEDRKANRA
jgi:prevent-host-death family protein